MVENVIISNCFDCYGLLSRNLSSCCWLLAVAVAAVVADSRFSFANSLFGRFGRAAVCLLCVYLGLSRKPRHFSFVEMSETIICACVCVCVRCCSADAMLTIMPLARHVHSLNLKIFAYDVYKRISKGFIYSIKRSFFGCVFVPVRAYVVAIFAIRLSLNRIWWSGKGFKRQILRH